MQVETAATKKTGMYLVLTLYNIMLVHRNSQ